MSLNVQSPQEAKMKLWGFLGRWGPDGDPPFSGSSSWFSRSWHSICSWAGVLPLGEGPLPEAAITLGP